MVKRETKILAKGKRREIGFVYILKSIEVRQTATLDGLKDIDTAWSKICLFRARLLPDQCQLE